MPTLLDPTKLHTQRIFRGWTQQQLADIAGLSLRQIVTLESDLEEGSPGRPIRTGTLEKLIKALRVKENDLLADERDGPMGVPGRKVAASRIYLGASLDHDLIQHRYGISAADIVYAAPMLFMVAVRASLAWRQEAVTASRTHLEAFRSSMGYALSEEGREMLERVEADLLREAEAVARGEPFTPSDDETGRKTSSRFMDWVDAMSEDPDDVELVAIRKSAGGPTDISVPYNVCRGTLFEIAGRPGEAGAEAAIYALVDGKVRIPDIPADLMAPEKRKERIAWLGEGVELPEDEFWAIEACPTLYESTSYWATRGPARPEKDQ